jgi:16S rRNA (adenine1518-N6/adenine1519-N6)-dimethyltransferase
VTHSRSTIAALLARIERRPRQSLGQNFVADANTVRRIVRLAGVEAGDSVVEIGGDLVPLLREQVEPLGVRVVHADAMDLDWNQAFDTWGIERASLVANLPYNISTPLICDLLDAVPRIDRMLVMVQREVAERLVARAGSATYGIPSVKVAYWAESKIVGHVPASVFVPQPKVESPTCCSRSCAPGSASGARCCGARWSPWCRRSSSPWRASRPTLVQRSSPCKSGARSHGP